MSTTNKVKTMTTIALLCAVGILVPQIMPRITIGPASYTLASHVAVFLAMFISPLAGVVVALITTLGFFLTGLPFVIVMRALSHVVFVALGAFILKKFPKTLQSPVSMVIFAVLISLVHAVCEVIVAGIIIFPGAFTSGYLVTLIGFIGLGGFIHSLIDFSISVLVWAPVQHFVSIPANAKIRVTAK